MIDETAVIRTDATIGPDTTITSGSVIGRMTRIGRNCYLDTVTIGRDSIVGNKVVMLALALVGSRSVIGDEVMMDRYSSVMNGTVVGPFSSIGRGAHVCENVTIEYDVVIGRRSRIGYGAMIGEQVEIPNDSDVVDFAIVPTPSFVNALLTVR